MEGEQRCHMEIADASSISFIHGHSILLPEEEWKWETACASENGSPMNQRGGWIAL